MTKRENLVALLRGRQPRWTPCSINFNQWYQHHRNHQTLPEDLQSTDDYIGAMKALGMDIFSRNIDGGIRSVNELVELELLTEQTELGRQRTARYVTPFGTLTSISQEQAAQTTSYQVEDLVKDWSRQRQAYLHLLDGIRFKWDRDVYATINARIGDDGVPLIPLPCTPLKRLQQDFGLDNACLFMLDEPEAAKMCCDLYWKRVRPLLEEIAASPAVYAGCMMDNVDTPFYPPDLASRYWTPYVREAADLFRSHGKRLLVHACGHLKQLMDVFRAAEVHGLEGMAHPPLGDFTPADARAMPRHFIYNGGFSAHEQVTRSDDELRAFYRDFFRQIDGLPSFIFAAACQTTVTTPWQRIKLAVQLCRSFGGEPTCAGNETTISS